MRYEKTISIPQKEIDEMNRLLSLPTMPDTGPDEVIKTYTAQFHDGIEIDIKVCNAEPPFVDPVMFQDGGQVSVMEVADEVDGEYTFDLDGDQFVVVIKGYELHSEVT